jgi:hypothetical protein
VKGGKVERGTGGRERRKGRKGASGEDGGGSEGRR